MSKRVHLSLFLSMFAAWLCLLSGCVPAPFAGPVPKGLRLLPLPLFDKEAPIAWHPSGKNFSTSKKGLSHYDLATGQILLIDREQPDQIVWSPDGTRLAAAYQLKDATRILLRDADGQLLAATDLPGVLDTLLWSKEAGLLLITSQLKEYSFGSDLKLYLNYWDGISPAQTTVLYNATIKPSTSRDWQQGLIAKSTAALSPDQDELLYLQLHDPPAFTGDYRLTLRHLKSGAEKIIASLPIGLRSVQFIMSDRVLVDNNGAGSLELSLWSGELSPNWGYSGRIRAISPSGHFVLIGEQLLQNAKPIGHFPGVTAATFSADGSRLLLQINKRWHLLEGLREPAHQALSPADLKKLLQLRNWRSRGLITPQEFQNMKIRITQP